MILPGPLSTLAAAAVASSGQGGGSVAVGEAGADMTLWLAVSAVLMIAVLVAAQWVVGRAPRA